MDSKQDYFTSPALRNFENFYSPFRLLRREDDPLLLSPLTSPFNRNSNSSFSPYSSSKAEQSSSDNNEKPERKELVPKKIQAIISFDHEDQSEQDIMETPQSKHIKIANAETAARKSYDLRIIESNEKNQNFKDRQKGLRCLSKQAFQILKTSEPLTYQGVAQRIIEESEDLFDNPQKTKEKQSIRRRVYDALNVLISIGLLEKDGKKILVSKKAAQEQRQNETKKHSLTQELTHKLKVMEAKKERLEKMKLLKNSIQKAVLLRSMEKDQKVSKIEIPLMIAKSMKKDIDAQNEQVKVKACGDFDSLALLKFSMGV